MTWNAEQGIQETLRQFSYAQPLRERTVNKGRTIKETLAEAAAKDFLEGEKRAKTDPQFKLEWDKKTAQDRAGLQDCSCETR
jgi:hypothetical protein